MPELSKLHIRKVGVNSVSLATLLNLPQIQFGLENPCKIAYDSVAHMFGVGCTVRQACLVGENEIVAGSFKLIDESTFKGACVNAYVECHRTNAFVVTGEYQLNTAEVPTALALVHRDSDDGDLSYFALGTTLHGGDGYESTSGRIILFTASTNEMAQARSAPQPIPVAVETVQGCVYAIAGVQGSVIVTVNSSVGSPFATQAI